MTPFIAYDVTLKRPGCAIMQAAYGCEPRMADHFDPQDWLLSPTEGMRVYPITPELLPRLVAITEAAR